MQSEHAKRGDFCIESTIPERVVEAGVLGIAAVAINGTIMDALSYGYGADIVGTAAGASLLSLAYKKGDSLLWPTGTALAITTTGEWSQRTHYFDGHSMLDGLDGVYDEWDFAAFGLGAALYVGIQKGKRVIRRFMRDN